MAKNQNVEELEVNDEVETDEVETVESLSTKDVASQVGTDPKTLRRFLRASVRAAGGTVGEDTPGQGGRYSFVQEDVEGIKAQFSEWLQAREAAKEARAKAQAEIAEDEIEELVDDEVEELEV
jgi:hypothetical protein